ncbi:MAG TPA: universal stress protein [Methyloceanibacter sp.]|nr:universal stress protein [Methyloceanibacter sp.]
MATDFSTRSDRALRRGSLLARQAGSELVLIHVVDDDQPRSLIDAEREQAASLLHDLVRTVRDSDGIDSQSRVVLGDAFQSIVEVADELDVDLLVLGPHRRQVLRDSFFGTTAERTIRTSRKPVIMANGVPAGPYRRVLLATDFSAASFRAAQAAKELGFLASTEIVALHVLDSAEGGRIVRAATPVKEGEDRLAKAEARARTELEGFTRKLGVVAAHRAVKPSEDSTGMAINDAAKTEKADLIVVGTHGAPVWKNGSWAASPKAS